MPAREAALDAVVPLNSERIEARFGSYGIEVVKAEGELRVSNLHSGPPGDTTTRTLAVVLLPGRVDPRLAGEHQAIIAGGSIGAVLRESGWTVRKHHLWFGELTGRPEWGRLWSMLRIAPQNLAVHVYELEAAGTGEPIPYATIAELHHPDYLPLDDLTALFPSASTHRQDRERAQQMLALVRREVAKL